MTIEIYSFLTVFSFFLFNCYFSSHKSPLGNISYFPLSKFCHQLHLLSLSIIQLSHYLLSMILLPGKYNAPTISVLVQCKDLLITIFQLWMFCNRMSVFKLYGLVEKLTAHIWVIQLQNTHCISKLNIYIQESSLLSFYKNLYIVNNARNINCSLKIWLEGFWKYN